MIENINTRFGEKPTIYTEAFSEYKKMFGALYDPSVPSHCMEMHFESCRDWSLFSTVSEVAKWYTSIVENHDMKVEVIPLGQCKGWSLDASTGNLNHASKDFFSIQGVRVETSSREVSSGWDQPILTQIGLDGGILGLMRKRFTGVPHYLCEAKMEPGNYNIVQISPTLQATFANINSVHGGRKPLFLKYFSGSQAELNGQILYNQWLSEDGGRFFNKRNKGMLIEVSESVDIEMPSEHFMWLSLFQIKQLLLQNAWVNPHIRGIISHV